MTYKKIGKETGMYFNSCECIELEEQIENDKEYNIYLFWYIPGDCKLNGV